MGKFFCVLIVAAACAGAQTVEGTVTNVATGGPIAGAKVALRQDENAAYSATTDAEGHFHIEGVKEGAYSVRYSADRYFYPVGPGDVLAFQVRANGVPVRIVGRMIPLSRVSGRVVDTRGDPVAKARVELTTLSAFWATETDAKGNFELDSVIPVSSNYVLSAAAPADWKAPGPDPDSGQPRGWVRTFYPGAVFREQAAPIAVRVGGDLLGLEIKLLNAPMHAVSGVLLNPDGAPVPKGAVALWDTGPRRDAAYRAESKPDGTFEFAAVVDGDWRISATLESGDVELRADEWIVVKGREIEGVKLRLGPPFTVKGRVILETRQGMPSPVPPEVTLIRQHGGQMLFQGMSIRSVRPEADGRFRFEDLYPGNYRVLPGAPPPLFYVSDVRLGDTTVLEEVEFSAGSADLTIFYKANGGTVRGTVEKCESGQVWLVSQDAPARRHYAGTCDGTSNGPSRFEITGVPPGDYYALAVPGYELWPGNVDAAWLQRATRLSVRSGETTQAELSLFTAR